MKDIFHLSLSSHQEVMYRDEADLNWGFNCLAEACLETDSGLLAEGFMSTHYHSMVFTDAVKALFRKDHYAYTRYFNARHHRRGRLGENRPFVLPIDGLFHMTAALNYVLRQGLHHGVTATPFGYPHCSVNAFFRKDLHRMAPDVLMPDNQRYKYLTDRSSVPLSIRMDSKGLLLREDVLDTSYVEKIYVTPRNFLFQMNRISDEKWEDEQKADNTKTPIITPALIETGVKEFNPADVLRNELGKVNTNRMTDIELCGLIDNVYIQRISGKTNRISVYDLSYSKRAELGNKLWTEIPAVYKKITSEAQIRRCICLDY